MRHAKRNQRLSRPSEHRGALLNGLVKGLIVHGQIKTTHARAKEAQRIAEHLITLGKEGSIHSRRRAFRLLQDRALVAKLFVEVAPRFVDVRGGYTRVVRLNLRRGDGAQRAVLAFSRLPAQAVPSVAPKPSPTPKTPSGPQPQPPQKPEEAQKPKKFFEGLRDRWTRKKKGSAAA